MVEERFEIPIVMIVFNRLDTTKKVFRQIQLVKPTKLYIISDAPRRQKEGEFEQVEEVRKYIETHIDWECEKVFEYAIENMGCQKRVSSGLNLVFENEEMAIILEDDCVPRIEFFFFCKEMLMRYKDDERIMQISGCKLFPEYRPTDPYIFSMFCSIWGWATWKRAWAKFDFSMEKYPEFRKRKIIYRLLPETAAQIIEGEMDRVFNGRMNSWGYRWLLSCYVNYGVGITPPVNLVENIGFGRGDATHTQLNDGFDFTTGTIEFPIPEINVVYRDYEYERLVAARQYPVNIVQRLIVRYLPDSIVMKIKKMYYKFCEIIGKPY